MSTRWWFCVLFALLGTVALADSEVIIVNGRALAPVRYVSESFGASITYDSRTKAVNVSFGVNTARMVVDEPVAYIGDERRDLDTPVVIVDGSAYVPVRVVADIMGAEIVWNTTERAVVVVRPRDKRRLVMMVSDKPLPPGLAKQGKVPPGHAKNGRGNAKGKRKH